MKLGKTYFSGSLSFDEGNNTLGPNTAKITGSFTGSFDGVFTGNATNSISGAFTEDSSSLASRITDLENFDANLDNTYATDSDVTAVSNRVGTLEGKTLLSSSAQIADDISGSFTSVSSSIASDLVSNYLRNTTDTLTGDLTVTGTLTAQDIHVQEVTSSIVYSSGSNTFGSSSTDTQVLYGKVGLGTNAPVTDLHLYGTGPIITATSTNNSSGLRYNISGSALEAHRFQYGGSTLLQINANGNVGIGTDSPSYKLHIVGASSTNQTLGLFTASNSNNTLAVSRTSISQSYIGLRAQANIAYIDAGPTFGINITGNDGTSPTERLRIDSAGLTSVIEKLGVGTTFSTSFGTIHSFGSATGMAGEITVQNGNEALNNYTGLTFKVASSGTDYRQAGIFFNNNGTGYGRGDLIFANRNDANGAGVDTGDTKMVIKPTGNVGIGTTSPDAIFHIAKSNAGGLGGQIVIDNPVTSTLGNTVELSFLTDSGASGAGVRNGRIKIVNENAGNGAANMQFWTWNGSSEEERMRIDSSGRILLSSSLTYNFIGNNTADAADNERIFISGGGDASAGRGGIIAAYGNEFSTNSGHVQIQAGRVADASIVFFTGETTTTDRMRIDSSGRVGIGTTPSAWFSVYRPLQLGSYGATITGQSNDERVGIWSNIYADASNVARYVNNGAGSILFMNDGGLTFEGFGVGTTDATATGTPYFKINSSGYVGIGSSSPAYKLDVAGDVRATGQVVGQGMVHTYYGGGNTPANSANWYKIVKIDTRGGGILTLSFTGGSFAPTTYVIKYYKNWTDDWGIIAEKYAGAGWLQYVRIKQDATDNKYYLEIYGISYSAGLSFNIYHDWLLGYNASSTIYTGTLTATGAGGTVITDEIAFADRGISMGELKTTRNAILASNSSTRVGIGTGSPSTKLHVYGDFDPDDALGYVLVENTNTTSGGSQTNSAVNVKNYHGTSQFMQWEENGLRLGSRITANGGVGDVVFTAGNDSEKMRLLAGGGLTFNGDTAAANALDDYEEGTWTITYNDIVNCSSVSTSGSPKYTKIGNVVHLAFEVSGGFTATGTETLFSFSLPFTAYSTVMDNVGTATFYIGTGANRFGKGSVWEGTTSSSKTFVYIPAREIQQSGTWGGMRVSLTYFTA